MGYGDVQQSGSYLENPVKMRLSGIYLMLFAVIPSIAWLMEIFSTDKGSIPESVAGMNLSVNVVHVFDLAFTLPAIMIGAILLFRGKMSGLIISSISAAFVFFTCLSILTMELGLQYHNLHFDVGHLYSMYLLTLLGIFPLIMLFRAVSKISPDKYN